MTDKLIKLLVEEANGDTQTPYWDKIHPLPGLSIATFVQLLVDSNLKPPENH
jgi:hypothetical protein